MKEQEARQFALRLMETSEAAYLSTVDGDGCPHIRAMLNLRNKRQYPGLADLFAAHQADLLVYFTTNTSSAKMEQLRANPAVAVYYCDPARFHGLMLGGTVEVTTNPQLKQDIWQDGWEEYYPSGPNDPDHTVLRLSPSIAKGWRGEVKFGFSV
jgi:general stress protein 26